MPGEGCLSPCAKDTTFGDKIEVINQANKTFEDEFDHEMYIENNNVKRAHNLIDTNVIVYELEKTSKGAYRAKIADTESFSTNVFFVDNI